MTPFVLDTETSLKNQEVGKFLAHPMCRDNWIVWLGVVALDADFNPGRPATMKFAVPKDVDIHCPGTDHLIIGHNVGFDILHLCNGTNKSRQEWIDWLNHPDSLIWDTQIAEYRLSGQTEISPSLDSCCERRGWDLKPGKMKEYWQAGISTEEIPDEEVEPYLKHDVRSTAALFKDQLMQAQARGMLDMLRIEMKSRLTTLVMELNGMHFEADVALKVRDEVIAPLREQAEKNAIALGSKVFDLPVTAINPGSPSFLKSVLYGGVVKWKEQHPMLDENGTPVYFKSGKQKGEPRKKWQEFERIIDKPFSPLILEGSDEEALGKIMEHAKCPQDLQDFLQEVINFRDGQKQERTYFTGYAELTWSDGMIHGNLNHAITATGRLSSTNPNLQNAGHSPIREHFTSRYKDGHLMEVDLSQIEVVVQAFLSADTNMIHDIENGIDFHSKRAAFAHSADYWEVKQAVDDNTHPQHKHWSKIRKGAKIVSFQKAYGAGVKKISATTGLSKAEVQAFMDAEDANYPNVPKTQEAWIAEVKKSTRVRDGRTCGILTTPIGVEYRFFQDDFNGHKDYKPTCIKNYPIQGFSADILKMILSELRAKVAAFNSIFPEAEPVLLVNTVHDSVIFDVPSWVDLPTLGASLREHFITYPISVLKDTWGVDFNVPISADVDVGVNWRNMETITV